MRCTEIMLLRLDDANYVVREKNESQRVITRFSDCRQAVDHFFLAAQENHLTERVLMASDCLRASHAT